MVLAADISIPWEAVTSLAGAVALVVGWLARLLVKALADQRATYQAVLSEQKEMVERVVAALVSNSAVLSGLSAQFEGFSRALGNTR